MIVRLSREQQKIARRQLLNDVVYILSHDALKQLQSDGHTTLSPVEAFLSAQEFCKEILALPDITEGLNDEIEDLEGECDGKDETAMILAVASVQMQALSKRRIGANYNEVITLILDYLDGNELFMPLVEQMTRKEEARWVEGKKSDLLNYELKEIELEGGGSEEVRQLFEEYVSFSDKTDSQGIKEAINFLNWYNNNHGHNYDDIIDTLYKKLGIKNIKTQNTKVTVESGGKYIDIHNNDTVNQ